MTLEISQPQSHSQFYPQFYNPGPGPWIYINGHAGVGKLTIALELQKLIPRSKVIHNHLVIDLCKNVFEQASPEYETLRAQIRSSVLMSITSSQKGLKTPYIFTGAHMTSSFNPIGPLIATQHSTHAAQHRIPFISVLLICEEVEHLRRATSLERMSRKLTNLEKLREMRNMELFSFRDGKEEVSTREVRIDVTSLSPGEAAIAVLKFVREYLEEGGAEREGDGS